MNNKVLLVMILISCSVYGQSKIDIEQQISKIIAEGDETTNSAYYNLLVFYFENPIDINEATREELRLLNLLTDEQIKAILGHRAKTGAFASLLELQAIQELTLEDINKILPFVIVREKLSLRETLKGIAVAKTNYLTTSYSRILEEPIGFKEKKYIGSPDKVQFRLRLRNPGKLSIGFTTQKDPGEPWIHKNQSQLPDYITGHVYLEDLGRVRQLALGDYKLQFGQGLLLGAGFMTGKNIETVTATRQSTIGIVPYSSVTEANFFRGVAASIEINKAITATLFYSNQLLDATVIDNTNGIVSSIRYDGLHRTESEIANMDQLHEQVWGGVLNLNYKRFSSGIIYLKTAFDKLIMPDSRTYNYYSFKGRTLDNFSWYGEYRVGSFNIFGELGKSLGFGWGFNSGIIGQISRYIGMSLSVRYFDKDFYSLYAQTFSERSTIRNENAIYWGLKLHPIKEVTISGYYDLYRFPWLTSSTVGPSHGRDMMLRVDYDFTKENRVFVQVRNEIANSYLNSMPVDKATEERVMKGILNFDYSTSASLSFRSRVQYNRFNKDETGILLLQDINYNIMKFSLSGRVTLFDTQSYDTRQYVYEKDMLYSFTTRAFFGKGISYYLLAKYKPIRNLSLRAKFSLTEYLNQSAIGSGYNLIEGNTRTQVSAQLHYSF